MANSLIVFCSQYGSTKRYVDWISKRTDSDVVEASNVTKQQLIEHDVLVFGGYIKKSRIMIQPVIQENWETIMDKKIILFLSAGAKPHTVVPFSIYCKEFPAELRKKILFYPVGGCVKRSIMSKDMSDYLDSVDLEPYRQLLSDEDFIMLENAFRRDFDDVDEKYIDPIVNHILEWNEDSLMDEMEV